MYLILPQWAPNQPEQGFIVTLAVGQPRPGMLDDAPREVSQQAAKRRGQSEAGMQQHGEGQCAVRPKCAATTHTHI